MQFGDFVTLVWLKYKGKGKDKAPAAGTPAFNNILAITNSKLRHKWAIDPQNNWATLFRIDSHPAAATVTLKDDVAKVIPRDYVALSKDTAISYLPIIHPTERHKNADSCYVTGSPKVLNFTSGLPAQYQGGTVSVPVNTYPPLITSASDVIVCDNLNWLKCDVAADLSYKKAYYADLVNEAADEYGKMIVANATSGSMIIDTDYSELG